MEKKLDSKAKNVLEYFVASGNAAECLIKAGYSDNYARDRNSFINEICRC